MADEKTITSPSTPVVTPQPAIKIQPQPIPEIIRTETKSDKTEIERK